MEPESGAIEHPCADHSGRTALVPRVYVCVVRVWVCVCVLRMCMSLSLWKPLYVFVYLLRLVVLLCGFVSMSGCLYVCLCMCVCVCVSVYVCLCVTVLDQVADDATLCRCLCLSVYVCVCIFCVCLCLHV